MFPIDFYRFNYYYFTIKNVRKPYHLGTLRDINSLIDYVKIIILDSTIHKAIYTFELDSKGHLHIHGICCTADKLIYNRLYREKGYHHKFSLILPPTYHDISRVVNSVYLERICQYMLKDMFGKFVVKQFKHNYLIKVTTEAYWY